MAGGFMKLNEKVRDGSVFQVNLTAEEVGMSSTYRELRGVEEGLKALEGRSRRGRSGGIVTTGLRARSWSTAA